MSPDPTKTLVAQLDTVVADFESVAGRASYDDLSETSSTELERLTTLARAAVARIGGRQSVYMEQVDAALKRTDSWDGEKLKQVIGVVRSLRADLDSGYLRTLEELIHGELFGDFLEMADYLLEESYKDPAAVVAGSTLEEHLRQMCKLNGIATEATSGGALRPKKADLMNSELAAASVCSKLDQKNVTAWLDLRNKAAHGKYKEYTKGQVELMVAGIRDFITRNPA